ncbi:hypothetical protein EVB91_282 [Rhizobium phage RHph_I1_18]|nr:hypothetical protein EVB91_282 [Rhizobium phage RHph_I1_18]
MKYELSEEDLAILEFLVLADEKQLLEAFGDGDELNEDWRQKAYDAFQGAKYVGAYTVKGGAVGAAVGSKVGSLIGGASGIMVGATALAGYGLSKLAAYKIQKIRGKRRQQHPHEYDEHDKYEKLDETKQQRLLNVARALI